MADTGWIQSTIQESIEPPNPSDPIATTWADISNIAADDSNNAEVSTSNPNAAYFNLLSLWDGSPTGTNRYANPNQIESADDSVYGDDEDLWETSLSFDDICGADFGIVTHAVWAELTPDPVAYQTYYAVARGFEVGKIGVGSTVNGIEVHSALEYSTNFFVNVLEMKLYYDPFPVVHDGVTVSDSITRGLTLAANLHDDVIASDEEYELVNPIVRSLADNVILTDESFRLLGLARLDLNDSVAISDGVNRILHLAQSLYDSVSVSDNPYSYDITGRTYFTYDGANEWISVYVDGQEAARFKSNGDLDLHGILNTGVVF